MMNKSEFWVWYSTFFACFSIQKSTPRRSGRFWMKSVRSCFPNCQIFLEDFLYLPDHDVLPFKMWHPHSSLTSSFFYPLISLLLSSFSSGHSSSALAFTCIIVVQVMGMAAETQFHVLAVDDSLIDRMLIERLLKTSSFHGNFY